MQENSGYRMRYHRKIGKTEFQLLLLKWYFCTWIRSATLRCSGEFNVRRLVESHKYSKNSSVVSWKFWFEKQQDGRLPQPYFANSQFGKFATFSDFKKFKIIFKKPIYFFLKKPKFWTSWEILLFQSHSTASLLPWAIFKKFKIFFRKTNLGVS